MLDHGKSTLHVYTTISNAILLLAACLSQAQVPFAFLPGSDKLTTNGCSVRVHQESFVGQALVACLQHCVQTTGFHKDMVSTTAWPGQTFVNLAGLQQEGSQRHKSPTNSGHAQSLDGCLYEENMVGVPSSVKLASAAVS